MEDTDKIYDELKKKYSDEEIADAFILPSNPPKKEELEEISKFIKESKMGYNGINHGMGWPGNDTFPKWAIDIIMFRNKCFDNDIMDICHKYNCSLDIAYMSIKSKYEHIDKSLNEMIKFIESNSK